MRPKDFIELARNSYAKPDLVEDWSAPQLVDDGLNEDEVRLLERTPVKTGRLLLLGVGGGREAIPLAKQGFEVIGVDFVPEMIAHAKANARRQHVEIEGLVQDICSLKVPPGTFDVVWFTTGLYSSVPTRACRISVLQSIHNALRQRGCVVCQFYWDPSGANSRRRQRLGALVASLTFGNREAEDGDLLLGNVEFIHLFRSEHELRSEFEAAGFSVNYLDTCTGGAILVKGPM